MAGSVTQFPLKYKIEADGKQAKAEIKDVDKLINKLGGGVSFKNLLSTAKSDFGSLEGIVSKAASSITVPFSAAAGAVAGIGTAVTAAGVGIGLTLFNLSKEAADFGSEIYNVSVKTGLSAETISSLKLASDRTGVSMESLGTIVNRF